MPKNIKGFVVAPGRRPNGTPYWIVRGTIGGKQIRREFSAKPDAVSFRIEQDNVLFGTSGEQSTVLTRLSTTQVRKPALA